MSEPKIAPGPYADALAAWGVAFRAARGRDYQMTPQDRSQFGRFFRGCKPDLLAGMFRRYLASTDPFCVKQGYSLTEFTRTANRWTEAEKKVAPAVAVERSKLCAWHRSQHPEGQDLRADEPRRGCPSCDRLARAKWYGDKVTELAEAATIGDEW